MNNEFKLLKVGHCCHPEAMVMRGHSWKSMNFPAIVGLIQHPTKGYVLFDTGYAKRFFSETQRFPENLYRLLTPVKLCDKEQLLFQLNNLDIDADEIKTIFISHFHADHISGLLDFPNAKYICSRAGLESFQQRSRLRGLIKGYLRNLLPTDFIARVIFIEEMKRIKLANEFLPFIYAYDIFSDGSCVAVDLPGHAFGHYGLLYYESNKVNFMVGDACWTEEAFKYSLKPNPLVRIIMSDGDVYLKTIDKLSSLYGCNHKLNIIPSHCQKTYDEWCREN